jgi:hypothetical protein
MSRGVVGCDRSKLRAAAQFGQKLVRSGASQSSSVDGASRGRKWGRRHGAPTLARGKRRNEGRRRVSPFYGGLAVRRGGNG